jgi:hypothetical protein
MLREPTLRRAAVAGLLAPALAGLAGCAGAAGEPSPFQGLDRAERYAEGGGGPSISGEVGPPPVTINGQPVEWSQLHAPLSEAAGAAVIEEIALERQLEMEMARRGLSITEQDVARERRLLEEVISSEADGAGAEQLVDGVRRRRGLGPQRYASLLRRNAMLRELVRERVEVRPDQVELAWRVQHGERVRLRIIVLPTEREAHGAREELLAGDPSQLESRIIALAEARSTDASSARGGLIEPFSLKDPAYEASVRAAAERMQPGQLAPIVAIRNGFALVYLDEQLPADGVPLDEARPRLERELRVRQERLMMDDLAAQLLADARVTTFDDALSWSRNAGSP